VTDDDFFNLLIQNILENDTARKRPPKEEHLTNREQNIDFADSVGLVNDATRFDADVTNQMDQFQQGTADPLPYAGGHWQADAALGGDANYKDDNQPFEVDEQHNTSTTPEKKHFKSKEVDSPEVTPLTEFLTTPSQKKVDHEAQKKVDYEDNEGVCDVWKRNKTSLIVEFGVYSIAEVWEWQSQLNRKPDNYNWVYSCLYCDLCSSTGMLAILIPNSRYEHKLQYSTKWYISGIIVGFAAMVQHDAHITNPYLQEFRPCVDGVYSLPRQSNQCHFTIW
jgi:hypothetical protein